MIEIRPIREHEAEPFLGLLCNVFDLDIARARNIFYGEPLFDLNRKWALFEDGEPISILTTVGLEFGWGKAIGIAGVATHRHKQGRGHATRLLEHVLEESQKEGAAAAYLFARDQRVYEHIGFELLDEAVYAPIQGQPEFVLPRTLSFEEIKACYTKWSEADPSRLRRDEKRWKYWQWTLRVCTEHTSGYLCLEGSLVREVVPGGGSGPWILPAGTEWFGLRSMAKVVAAPIRDPRPELMLMGWRSPMLPQFFMTDQF
jgi:N-acetylglutamate synthase-like GNAT family acetyltransferase